MKPESPNVHTKTTKIQRWGGRGRKKKERNFGRSGGTAVRKREVRRRGTEHTQHNTHTHTQHILAQKRTGVNWQNTMAQNGLAKNGQSKVGHDPSGGRGGGGSGGRWSREVQTNNNHNNHNHNNAKPRTSGARRVGPRRVGPLSQGLGLGLWSLGFLGSENLAKTLKH